MSDPYLLVAVQVFDGITAAVLSVMVPLIVADVAFGSGHFNLAQGIVGTATGIGALAQHGAGRLYQRHVWQQHSLHRAGGGRGARPDGDLAVHAGDPAAGVGRAPRSPRVNHAMMEGAIVLRYSAL